MLSFTPRTKLDWIIRVPEVPLPGKTSGYQEGDPVFCKNFGTGEPWLPGGVVEVQGNRLLAVKTRRGILDNICIRYAEGTQQTQEVPRQNQMKTHQRNSSPNGSEKNRCKMLQPQQKGYHSSTNQS
ncbi:hypothetical protein MTO96_022098 [Rhipicephalus appendiculatus]